MSTIKTIEFEHRIDDLEQNFEDMEILLREMVEMINELSETSELRLEGASQESKLSTEGRVASLEKELERLRRISMVVLENLNNLTEGSINEPSHKNKGVLHVIK